MTSNERVAEATAHPLEPLSSEEISGAVETLRKTKDIGESFRFVSVTLNEPPKEAVRDFDQNGRSVEREAFVILLDKGSEKTFEAMVSLSEGSVKYWKHIPDVQPPIMPEEFFECERVVKEDPKFREALRKRGITDFDPVTVDPWSAGHYEDEDGRRLLRALTWIRMGGDNDNSYAHPIENLIAFFDANKSEVVRVEDHGVVPVPEEPGNYTSDAVDEMRTDLKPIEITQPKGVSFEVNGHEVRWQKWRFRVGFTPREGLVLYTVGYEDKERVRPILYRASVSEMVVPYGDPAPTHSRKNAFDAGEYNIGVLANSLELGCDCLGEIYYFDAILADSDGEPYTLRNAVCMHEEDSGLLWKHTDFRTEEVEVRRSRRLVVSFIATVGNYEYGFYWYLYQDGNIECEVKATGIMSTGAVGPGEAPEYGQLLNKEGLYAPIHQHIFNFRLDMDVDGQHNSVCEVNTESALPGPENPLGNAFKAVPIPLKRESEAQRVVDTSSARYWKVVNPSVKNIVGEPVGYRLMPGPNTLPFVRPEAAVAKRAGFMTKHLWTTPYAPDEMYAAGDYPNQSQGGEGLPKWTRADRSIEDTDIVLWYTLNLHHPARLEDWPMTQVERAGFTLKPEGFFDHTPSLDVPPPSSNGHCDH